MIRLVKGQGKNVKKKNRGETKGGERRVKSEVGGVKNNEAKLFKNSEKEWKKGGKKKRSSRTEGGLAQSTAIRERSHSGRGGASRRGPKISRTGGRGKGSNEHAYPTSTRQNRKMLFGTRIIHQKKTKEKSINIFV